MEREDTGSSQVEGKSTQTLEVQKHKQNKGVRECQEHDSEGHCVVVETVSHDCTSHTTTNVHNHPNEVRLPSSSSDRPQVASPDPGSEPQLIAEAQSHGTKDESRCGGRAASTGRGASYVLDHDGAQNQTGRTPGADVSTWEADRAAVSGQTAEQSQQEKGRSDRMVWQQPQHVQHGKLNYAAVAEGGYGAHLPEGSSPRDRPGGLRPTWTTELHRGEAAAARLLQVGDDHTSRRAMLLPSAATCSVAERPQGPEDSGPEGDIIGQPCSQLQPEQRAIPEGHAREHEHDDEENGEHAGRTGGGPWTPPQEEPRRRDEPSHPVLGCHDRGHSAAVRAGAQTAQCETRECIEICQKKDSQKGHETRKVLTTEAVRFLNGIDQDIAAQCFQSVTRRSPVLLMEIACSPDSRLSAEMQKMTGQTGSAIRCSHWSGSDLSTGAGVKYTLGLIEHHQPMHVHISTECGPYSPIQNLNQRSEAQKQELANKRRQVLKQYVGGLCVLHHCIQKGIHVTWEWSEKCQAWRLPMIQNVLKKYQLFEAVTHGCQVSLRDGKTNKLSRKGWKIMTTHKRLAELMELRCSCPRTYQHAVCEGNLTRETAYYTVEYAKRYCRAILHEMTHAHLVQEFQGTSQLPAMFGSGVQCSCSELRQHEAGIQCSACYLSKDTGKTGDSETQGGILVGDQMQELELDRKVVEKQLYKLHAATGHSSIRNMVLALQKRGAPAKVIEWAKEFRCSVCEENGKLKPRHMASLTPLPPKWNTVCADGGHWTHPGNNTTYGFAIIIDEGFRFRAARIICQGKKQTMNASQFLQYFQEGWTQYFGQPQTLRLDPAGAFRSNEMEAYCDKHGIYLDVVPAEAHWKFGICEQAVQGLKEVMNRLATEDSEITAAEALSTAVRAFNERELVRGFSPIQHALGKAPDETGRFISSLDARGVDALVENPTDEFKTNIERMRIAEQAHSKWMSNERIKKAMNSRGQRVLKFYPGDLVYYWRKQLPKSMMGNKNGGFLGPARILVTETRRTDQGELTPGSAIWVVRGRRLLKCTPEQLRHATQKEEILEHLGEDPEQKAPWTMPRMVSQLGKQEYEDVTQETPTLEDWHHGQDPTRMPDQVMEDTQPSASSGSRSSSSALPEPHTRHRHKRPVEPRPATGTEMDEDEDEKHQKKSRETPKTICDDDLFGEVWWSDADFSRVGEENKVYWSNPEAAVEVAIDVPTTKRGISQFENDIQGYFIGALKRRAVEVSEKRMDAETKRLFDAAKQIEVKNFISAQAFEALPDHVKPPKETAVGMRWILTWKVKDDGTTKPKARAILLGYQDPGYEHRSTTTPVMTRQSRQMQLQMSAWKKWRTKKGDVSGAFLQGREYPGELFCIPCDEICKAMNLSPGTITKVKRGCYGLVDAPIEWYRSVSSFFEKIGLQKLWSDPCMWAWRPNGVLTGLISCHVDDFLFSGKPGDKTWEELLTKIQKEFSWGDWQSREFTQCGVEIKEMDDYSYQLSQPKYAEKIKEIPIPASRKRESGSPTTEWEKSQLRAALGALSWHAQQVSPHISAEVGLLLSEVSESSVDTIIRTNKLVYATRVRKEHKLWIHSFHEKAELGLFMWCDAAGQNRRDGSSTQGLFLGMGPVQLLDGSMEKVTPIAWHANKIDRVVRSPGAAEATAAVNGEDLLYHARFQWGEILGPETNVFEKDETVNRVTGVVISDSRNVYDKLNTEELATKGAERRTDLELLCLKYAQRRNGVLVRWVHSEAQLGNALTTPGAKELELYYQLHGQWKIVSDDQMRSARKRRENGLPALDNEPQNTQNTQKHKIYTEEKVNSF